MIVCDKCSYDESEEQKYNKAFKVDTFPVHRCYECDSRFFVNEEGQVIYL